jgi:hypothetical protein
MSSVVGIAVRHRTLRSASCLWFEINFVGLTEAFRCSVRSFGTQRAVARVGLRATGRARRSRESTTLVRRKNPFESESTDEIAFFFLFVD